jgi:hypothetical protein
MRKSASNIRDLYVALKADADRERPLWNDIARVVGISVEPNLASLGKAIRGKQKDEYVDDPTAAISVNQAGDYLHGIMWGTGANVFNLEPSDHVLDLATQTEIKAYYDFVSKRILEQMNHSSAGLNSAMKPYFYDQVAFGTAGIGAFPNTGYMSGDEDNLFIFRQYGVDNLFIDEGKNGLVDIVFVVYSWRTERVVTEFATKNGQVDQVMFDKLPKIVQDNYNTNNMNYEHIIVHGVMPRDNYSKKFKGKRGARYRGVWFLYSEPDKIFFEEDYKTMPIEVCRAIKIRGTVWGRASGTMLISTIRSVNYIVGKVIEIVEKQASPALGMWNGALLGDSVVDTSADGMVVLNPALAEGSKNPLFPLYDVGDPSNIIKFLLPYLNEKVATAFKIDVLLDFSDSTQRTATEMLQRSVIRGKSLASMIGQQKAEMLEPLIHRCVSIAEDKQYIGVNASLYGDIAAQLKDNNKAEMIIPEAVLKCKAEGKPWYKIRFNNELEKLSRVEVLDGLNQILNVITVIASVFPDIIMAIDWHKFLADFKSATNTQGQWMLSEDDFKAIVKAKAQAIAAQNQIQAENTAAGTKNQMGQATLKEAQARSVGLPSKGQGQPGGSQNG